MLYEIKYYKFSLNRGNLNYHIPTKGWNKIISTLYNFTLICQPLTNMNIFLNHIKVNELAIIDRISIKTCYNILRDACLDAKTLTLSIILKTKWPENILGKLLEYFQIQKRCSTFKLKTKQCTISTGMQYYFLDSVVVSFNLE